MSVRPWTAQERLDAELLDTIQHERSANGLSLNVRTRETRHEYPLPKSRKTPLLRCPYCGKRRCGEHSDLPALDPYFKA